MRRPRWRHVEGLDEHYEIEVRPDVFLAIHKSLDDAKWQAALFDSGAEELPFLTYPLTSRTVRGAKREAVERAAKALFRLVEALGRVKDAA